MIATGETIPANATSGRLRLIRSGGDLSYDVAEDAATEFTRVATLPIGAEDLDDLRLVASTYDGQAALDARFFDLHIRMGTLPNAVASPKEEVSRRWLGSAVLLGLLSSLALGAVLWTRRGRAGSTVSTGPAAAGQKAASARISFTCSACGKKQSVNGPLAGMKVRCTACNAVVQAPPPPGSSAAHGQA
jgi:hypothetical protein